MFLQSRHKMAGKFLYFAYGSNLLSQRIHINNTSAKRVGIGRLNDYQISFASYSKRWRGCTATIIPKKSSVVWGSLWQIDNADMENLDRQEGVKENLYKVLQVDISLPNGETVFARTYQQTAFPPEINDLKDLPADYRPSVAYWKTIIYGANESGLPNDYIDFLKRIPHNGYDGPVDIHLPFLEEKIAE